MGADMSLLDTAKRMNTETIAKIFDLYASAIFNYAFRLCNDPLLADYIVGDVFTRLAEEFSAGHGPIINLRVHLYKLAYHHVVDEAPDSPRSAANKTADFLQYVEQSAEMSAEKWELFDTTMKAIMNNLTTPQRHVLILRFLEGFSLKETAVIIGKNVNTVKVTQNRASTALREALGYPMDEINVTLKSFNYLETLKAVYPPELFWARRAAPAVPPYKTSEQNLHLAFQS